METESSPTLTGMKTVASSICSARLRQSSHPVEMPIKSVSEPA
ncbi:hypothetical protein CGRA01v4_14000 [Colletotrichum graminicola]|nr:hypothetical protein CGRA01v4_14000 [Colletotrichum graminicola]